jgi:hypothetical protein
MNRNSKQNLERHPLPEPFELSLSSFFKMNSAAGLRCVNSSPIPVPMSAKRTLAPALTLPSPTQIVRSIMLPIAGRAAFRYSSLASLG